LLNALDLVCLYFFSVGTETRLEGRSNFKFAEQLSRCKCTIHCHAIMI